MLELDKIYNTDCLEGMKLLNDKSIDMILCDLPYGTTACKWDSIIPLGDIWKQYKRIVKNNKSIVLTATNPFSSMLVMSNLDWFKYEWIWTKSRALGFTHCKNKPMGKHESILVFSNGKVKHFGQPNRMIYNPQNLKSHGKLVNGSKDCIADRSGHRFARPSNKEYIQEFTNYPTTILDIPNEGLVQHPTQKPLALFEYLIKTYSNKGDLVLDNCMGSGTTAIACKKLGRNFIGFETSKDYCDIANQRLKETLISKSLFDNP